MDGWHGVNENEPCAGEGVELARGAEFGVRDLRVGIRHFSGGLRCAISTSIARTLRLFLLYSR